MTAIGTPSVYAIFQPLTEQKPKRPRDSAQLPKLMHIIKDPALPAGMAEAFDMNGNLLATIKLPLKGLIPRNIETIRVSPQDYAYLVDLFSGYGWA